jgi:hypothetical protein
MIVSDIVTNTTAPAVHYHKTQTTCYFHRSCLVSETSVISVANRPTEPEKNYFPHEFPKFS